MRFAVISDLHSNASAFRAALAIARTQGFDELVLMGDCFTYGVEPRQVLALVRECVDKHGAKLLVGNHDELYLGRSPASTGYYQALPTWIRESVDWTRRELASVSCIDLPWSEFYVESNVFFAHANPHSFGDWSYLNSDSDFARATVAMRARGFAIGVFGHTHREKVASVSATECHVSTESAQRKRSDERVLLVNAGSCGQPRNAGNLATMMFLNVTKTDVSWEFVRIAYDVGLHRSAIMNSSMSHETKQHILRYLPTV